MSSVLHHHTVQGIIGSLQLHSQFAIPQPDDHASMFSFKSKQAVAVYSWRDYRLITVGLLHQHQYTTDYLHQESSGLCCIFRLLCILGTSWLCSVLSSHSCYLVCFTCYLFYIFGLCYLTCAILCCVFITSFVPFVFCPHLYCHSGTPCWDIPKQN